MPFPPQAPAITCVVAPSFPDALKPGDNVSSLTFSAVEGNRLLVNLALLTTAEHKPATMLAPTLDEELGFMLVFLPNGDQVAQVDYNGADTGVQCGYKLTPEDTAKVYLLNLTNGNVTLR